MKGGTEAFPYRLCQEINANAGTFSTIHFACDSRPVKIIKVTPRSRWDAFVTRTSSTMALNTEAQCLMCCEHPNIITLFTFVESETALYLELEYLPKGDLCRHLMLAGPYGDEDARALASELLTALLYLKTRDIIHRDIKPDNILRTGKKTPFALKLADFGCSRHICAGCTTLCGTPAYMAPELNTTKKQFPWPGYGMETDVWSLGVVYFLLRYGELPFDLDGRGSPELSTLWSPTRETNSAPPLPCATLTLVGLLQPEPTKRISLSTMRNIHENSQQNRNDATSQTTENNGTQKCFAKTQRRNTTVGGSLATAYLGFVVAAACWTSVWR
jgi:serine/threonine protein kinase